MCPVADALLSGPPDTLGPKRVPKRGFFKFIPFYHRVFPFLGHLYQSKVGLYASLCLYFRSASKIHTQKIIYNTMTTQPFSVYLILSILVWTVLTAAPIVGPRWLQFSEVRRAPELSNRAHEGGLSVSCQLRILCNVLCQLENENIECQENEKTGCQVDVEWEVSC